MNTPATDTLAALTDSLRLAWITAKDWLLPVLLLSFVGAVPEAWLKYNARAVYLELTGGGGMDLAALQFLAMAGLVGLMFSLVAQLVGVAWAFLVISEVAAGRPAGIREGLRRTLAWRLQLSWLVSAFLVSTAHRMWFIGGCFLLVPFGFALSDAYEAGTGMRAIGRANRLGFSVGPRGGKLGVPMALASTGLLLAIGVADTAVQSLSVMLSPSVNLSGGIELLTKLTTSPGSGADVLGDLLLALLPEPSVFGVVVTFILAPWPVITQLLVLVVPIVAYHDAVRIDSGREEPLLSEPAG